MCENIPQIAKARFKQIVSVLFQCFWKALEWHFNNFFASNFADVGFPNSLLRYWCYIQVVIVYQWFFLQPTQQASLYYFKKIYTMWFLLHLFRYHDLFCVCADDTVLVLNESNDNFWRDGAKQWSEVLHTTRFICMSISRFISFIFLSTSIALIIFSLYQLFPDFENIVSLPILALPILDAYPFSKNAQKIM